MEETWKVCRENTKYMVSNLGRVKSPYKILKPIDNGAGYFKVWLGRNINVYLHRLVANNFLENKNNLPEVNHKDGDSSNNKLENLEWVDSQYNINHKFFSNGYEAKKGEQHAQAKLTEEDVKKIRNTYPTVNPSHLAERYKVSVSNIYAILQGRSWKHLD